MLILLHRPLYKLSLKTQGLQQGFYNKNTNLFHITWSYIKLQSRFQAKYGNLSQGSCNLWV